MRDFLAIFAALFLIVLFFLPAHYIGPLYFLLVVFYLLALYAVERLGLEKTAEEAISLAFFLLVMVLMAKKAGASTLEVMAVLGLLLALELSRRRLRGRNTRHEE